MSEQDNTGNTLSYEDEGSEADRGGCTEYHGGGCSGQCKLLKHVGQHVCKLCGQTWE